MCECVGSGKSERSGDLELGAEMLQCGTSRLLLRPCTGFGASTGQGEASPAEPGISRRVEGPPGEGPRSGQVMVLEFHGSSLRLRLPAAGEEQPARTCERLSTGRALRRRSPTSTSNS